MGERSSRTIASASTYTRASHRPISPCPSFLGGGGGGEDNDDDDDDEFPVELVAAVLLCAFCAAAIASLAESPLARSALKRAWKL